MKTAIAAIVTAVLTISGTFILLRPRISFAAGQPVESLDAKAGENSLEQKIVAKEREGLDALKAGNVDLFASLTADDAVLVDAQGPASKSKAQVVKNVAVFRLTDYTMEDVKFLPLSGKSGLITYKISETGNSHGREFVARAYISSIWAERGGKWFCLFSQETVTKQ
jgi:ketosteroid isomerase-like protein